MIMKTASPIASSDHEAVLRNRWYDEKCFVAPEPAATIIRVTMPRPENNQPEMIVQRLAKLGAVGVGDSPCSNSWNPGTRYTARLLAQSEWV
jgi:hypothetical protein